MATPRVCTVLVLLAALLMPWIAVRATRAQEPKWQPVSFPLVTLDQQQEDKIRRELESQTRIETIDTELQQLVAYLADLHKIQILLDHNSLEDAGFDASTLITFHVENISLESALELMLREHGLTWTIEKGVLLITSVDRAMEQLVTRVYPVKDLVTKNADGVTEYKPLIGMIQNSIAIAAWDAVGGSSSIEPFAGLLVISTSEQVHRQIEALLQAVRKAESRETAKPAAEADARIESSAEESSIALIRYADDETDPFASKAAERNAAESADPFTTEAAPPEAAKPRTSSHATFEALARGQVPKMVREAEKRILQELNEPTTFEFVQTELSTILSYLNDLQKIQIVIDKKALEAIGISPDTLVTQHIRGVPLYLALDLMLEELGATWMVRDGLLVVTAEDATYSAKIYSLGDLLAKKTDGELDYDSIIELITMTVAPETWAAVGSKGEIQPYAGTLVIYQSAPVHRKIERLLSQLNAATQADRPVRHTEVTVHAQPDKATAANTLRPAVAPAHEVQSRDDSADPFR